MKYSELSTLLEDKQLSSLICDELNDLADAFYASDEGLGTFNILMVPENTIHDMLNELTYDTYGRLRRDCIGLSVADIDACRSSYVAVTEHDYPGIPRASLLSMCDFLEDLWEDNEAEGNNKPDGSYNKSCFVAQGAIQESVELKLATVELTKGLKELSNAVAAATFMIKKATPKEVYDDEA